MNNELFELCKEVYEKFPDWMSTGSIYYHNRHYKAPKGDYSIYAEGYTYDSTNGYTADFEPQYGDVPLYTSDYLLEKLPSWYFDTDIEETMVLALMPHMLETDKWIARYETPEHRASEFEAIADTPLKSLLKLTIALSEAGELNG